MAADPRDTKATADKRMADDRKKLQQERDRRAKDHEERIKKLRGRPTPTQEEADLIKLGHHPELEPDGSTDPYADETRHMEAEQHGGGYSTRQSTSHTPTPAAHRPSSSDK